MSAEDIPSLSPAEWEVMKTIWDHGPIAARDVHASLPSDRDWSIKTVKTMLSRLVAKGGLHYQQIGNSYLYDSAIARDDATRLEVQGLLARLFDNMAMPMIAQFIDQSDLNDNEIQELQQKLCEKRPGSRGRGRKR